VVGPSAEAVVAVAEEVEPEAARARTASGMAASLSRLIDDMAGEALACAVGEVLERVIVGSPVQCRMCRAMRGVVRVVDGTSLSLPAGRNLDCGRESGESLIGSMSG